MTLLSKIQYVFNKILLNLLKEIKDKDPELKKKIKKNYAVFDKSTDSHIHHFIDNLTDSDVFSQPYDEMDIMQESSVSEMNIIKDISVQDIMDVVEEKENEVIKCYMYILYMLSDIFQKTKELSTEDEEGITQMTDLFKKCMNLIKKEDGLDFDEEIENIFDDSLCQIFKNIFESRKSIKHSLMKYNNEELDGNENTMNKNPFDFLQNSKIGKLAQEITEDIDLDSFNMKDPSELLNIDAIFSGKGNNVLGDIISKVGSKVASKISNGDLKQEDLFGEAMSMMGKMNMQGGNNFMEEMMKSAMKMDEKPFDMIKD